MSQLAVRTDFFTPVPDRPRDDILADYLVFLEKRNGSVATKGAYPHREAWLAQTKQWDVRHEGSVDTQVFEQHYARYEPGAGLDAATLALLSFVKVNASEAYGVEVVARLRHGREASTLFEQVERVLGNEETYHTRILLGATEQFGVPAPTSAWRPPAVLKGLIATLAYSPKAIFHPVLLASEVGGVFSFNWMLQKVGEVFRDQPALRETLEERLIEILIDEVGHIAFNRMAVGPMGMSAARALSKPMSAVAARVNREFTQLGWDHNTTRTIDSFRIDSLPEVVRRNSFFV